jgi:FkbM family methyltransferase
MQFWSSLGSSGNMDIDIMRRSIKGLCRGAARMSLLVGPYMYYSLFGRRGLMLGAKARLLRKPIEVAVAISGIEHPVFLRLRTTDVALCRDILINAQYSCQLSRVPRAIVDAGANVGLTSIFYANRYPETRIVAIEPEASNYEMLRKNVASYSNITPIQAALWREHKHLRISDAGLGKHAFQIQEARESGGETSGSSVQGVTLDELMAGLDIPYVDLLKVDIEGAEKEVFENSAAWIERVGVVAVELHDHIREGCRESVHGAAKHFELEWQQGETTYFAREGHVSSTTSLAWPQTNVSEAATVRGRSSFPLKIVQVT